MYGKGSIMTDKEITEIIATKIMGWTRKPVRNMGMVWHDEDGRMRAFAPLSDDGCCMMAWDKIGKKHRLDLYNGQYVYPDNKNGEYTMWYASINRIECSNEDRRRAMCECMVKQYRERL